MTDELAAQLLHVSVPVFRTLTRQDQAAGMGLALSKSLSHAAIDIIIASERNRPAQVAEIYRRRHELHERMLEDLAKLS